MRVKQLLVAALRKVRTIPVWAKVWDRDIQYAYTQRAEEVLVNTLADAFLQDIKSETIKAFRRAAKADAVIRLTKAAEHNYVADHIDACRGASAAVASCMGRGAGPNSRGVSRHPDAAPDGNGQAQSALLQEGHHSW